MRLMISDIKEKEEEIKKIWLEHKDSMSTSQLYKQFLGPYFDIAQWKVTDSDWLFFLVWIRDWQKKIKKEEQEKALAKRLVAVTEEEAEEIQGENRKKMIVILSELIKDYQTLEDPMKKSFTLAALRRMYNSIQTLEERIKMTQISKGKLKLEAVKTLLPYQRMSLPEILELKEKLNESFTRILKLKSGESVGPDSPLDR